MKKGNALVGVLVVALLFWLFWHFVVVIGWMPNYSEGERTGQFYKVSKKGIFYKSWEGTIYLGGVSSVSDGQNTSLQLDKFYFSIPADGKAELIEKAKECANKRLVCTVIYSQYLKGPINTETSYIVQDIKLPN